MIQNQIEPKWMIALKKYKQTILMALSLLLVILFFMNWIQNTEVENGFRNSEIKMTGYEIFKGYHTLITMVFSLFSDKLTLVFRLLYLGYVMILFPVLGLAAIVLSGMRRKEAQILHFIHFVSSFVFLFLVFLMILLLKDVRIMFFDTFGLRFGFGYIATLILSGAGTAIVLLTRPRHKRIKSKA